MLKQLTSLIVATLLTMFTVSCGSGNKHIAVTGITLSKTTLDLKVSQTETLVATITPENASNKTVTWSSSDTNIATVSGSGLVEAKANGIANITATATDNGLTAKCTVTVTTSVTGITLDKTELDLAVNESYKLIPTITPTTASNKNVSYISDRPGIATVDSEGTVKGLSAGIATITATTEDGSFTATCTATVSNVAVSGITMKTATLIPTLEAETLLPVFLPANATNRNIQWITNNPEIATVSVTGQVTAHKLGMATITAITQDGGHAATTQITVVEITEYTSINNNGDSLGELIDPSGKQWSFVREMGNIELILPPEQDGKLYLLDINDKGEILGLNISDNRYFVRKEAKYEYLDEHTTGSTTHYTGLNNAGELSGYITDEDNHSTGFIKTGSTFKTIEHPGAVKTNLSSGTKITAINALGEVTGIYRDSTGIHRSFIYDGTKFTAIEHPENTTQKPINVHVTGINAQGHVSGYFWTADAKATGFTKLNTVFTETAVHEAAETGYGTWLTGINNSGRTTGFFDAGTNRIKGFVK